MDNKLSPAITKYFDLEGPAGVIITAAPNRERIDLRTVSLKTAKRLHKAGKLQMLKEKSVSKKEV
jgi:hypothetical protein